MTREEDSLRAFQVLQKHCSDNMLLVFVNGWPREDLHNITNAMLSFADAEAAAMRERAAGVALEHADGARHLHNAASKDSDRDGRLVHGEGWRTARSIWAAIRALPTTEVGNG